MGHDYRKPKWLVYRPGYPKHLVAHRVWLKPDNRLPDELNTRKDHCWKCLRPRDHAIHDKKYRTTGNWFGWRIGKECKADHLGRIMY